MSSLVIPLQRKDTSLVYEHLKKEEPWHIIALDTLQKYGIEHPLYRWFGEFTQHRLHGVILLTPQMIHFGYHAVPGPRSPIYEWLVNRISKPVITHGHHVHLQKLLSSLPSQVQYDTLKVNAFSIHTKNTIRKLKKFTPDLANIRIKLATFADYPHLITLLLNSEIGQETDHELIKELVTLRRVWVAETVQVMPQLVGSVMVLKESERYALLGGLYVVPPYRHQGVATLLGQRSLQYIVQKGKKACIYYDEAPLAALYQRAGFKIIGKWGSYMIQPVD